MEIGIYTFADVGFGDPAVGATQRIPELLDEVALADEVGLDVFGLGEHHRQDFAAPAPPVILAAAAGRTKRIRLTSAVTVLSTDDPVRVFEQFTALDLVSSGRAEIMPGRGALLDSFDLFGYSPEDYDALFEEKLELLLALRSGEPVNWEGRYRALLRNTLVVPRPVQAPLPIWLAVGGSQESVVRAARLGLPMTFAMLGGNAAGFVPAVDLYRRAQAHFGTVPQPIALAVHGFVADTRQQAADLYYAGESELMNRIGAERGAPPMTRRTFDYNIRPEGPHILGSPDEVIEKILYLHSLFKQERVLIQLAIGSMRHDDVMRAIELLGTKVAPAIRTALALPRR